MTMHRFCSFFSFFIEICLVLAQNILPEISTLSFEFSTSRIQNLIKFGLNTYTGMIYLYTVKLGCREVIRPMNLLCYSRNLLCLYNEFLMISICYFCKSLCLYNEFLIKSIVNLLYTCFLPSDYKFC